MYKIPKWWWWSLKLQFWVIYALFLFLLHTSSRRSPNYYTRSFAQSEYTMTKYTAGEIYSWNWKVEKPANCKVTNYTRRYCRFRWWWIALELKLCACWQHICTGIRWFDSVQWSCHARSDYFGGFLLHEQTRTNWHLKSNLDQSGCHVNVKFICMKLCSDNGCNSVWWQIYTNFRWYRNFFSTEMWNCCIAN